MIRDIERLTGRCRQVGTAIFGDRYGYVLWLGLLVTFGLYWRVGIFVTDTYTTANALVAVSNGHLHIVETPYSLTLGAQPGLHEPAAGFTDATTARYFWLFRWSGRCKRCPCSLHPGYCSLDSGRALRSSSWLTSACSDSATPVSPSAQLCGSVAVWLRSCF